MPVSLASVPTVFIFQYCHKNSYELPKKLVLGHSARIHSNTSMSSLRLSVCISGVFRRAYLTLPD